MASGYKTSDGKDLDARYVQKVNSNVPDETGNVTVDVGVTSVNGQTGDVNLAVGVGAGVGRGAAITAVSLSNTKKWTVPETGLASLHTESADTISKVYVFVNEQLFHTQGYTSTRSEYTDSESGNDSTSYHKYDWYMPFNKGDVVTIQTKSTHSSSSGDRYSFSGTLIPLKVIG